VRRTTGVVLALLGLGLGATACSSGRNGSGSSAGPSGGPGTTTGTTATVLLAVLKGSMLRIVTFNADNSMRRDEIAVTTLGRLPIATQGPDGDLYSAQDVNPGSIYRVHPAA
jgi:hypothetical protein